MKIHKVTALLLCFLLTAAVIPAAAEGTAVTLSVNASEQAARFQPQMLGSNVGIWEWGGYYPEPNEKLVRVIEEAGLKLLRFPGGSEADACIFDRTNTLEWHIGSGAYTRALRADFLDAFIGLCKRTGAEPLIIVNARMENAAMAADLVRYCNLEKGYGVKYFEVGNEPELYSGEYRITAEEYAARFAAYSEAMRAVDPSIQLMGSASSQPIYRESWAGSLMQSQGERLDAATLHWYPMVGDQENASHPCYPSAEHLLHYSAESPGYAGNEWHQSGAIQYAELFTRGFDNSLEQLRDRYSRGARIGVTELSPVTGGDNGAGLSDTAANALWFADVLGRLAYNGVDFANQFLLQGQQEYAMCDSYSAKEPYKIRPVWYTYVMYQRYFGDLMCRSASSNEQDLTIWASGDSGDSSKLKLMVVNKSESDAAAARVKLDGFTPLKTEGAAYVLSTESLLSTTMNINGVSVASDNSLPQISPQSVPNISENFTYTFPAHSVTCIELDGYFGSAPPLDTVEEGIAVTSETETFDSLAPGGAVPAGWKGKDLSIEAADGGSRLLLSCQDNSGGVFTLPNRVYFGRPGFGEAAVGGTLSTKEQSDYTLYKDKYFKVLDTSGEVLASLCINVDGWLQFSAGDRPQTSIDDGGRQGICLPAGTAVAFRIVFDLQGRTCGLELYDGSAWYAPSFYGSWEKAENLPLSVNAAGIGGVKLDYSSSSGVKNTICLDEFVYPVLTDIQPPVWAAGAGLAAQVSGPDTVRLSWPAAADNVAVKAYRIYQDDSCLAEVPPVMLEYAPEGLTPGRSYRFAVTAADREGNESAPLKADAVLPGGEPGFSAAAPILLSGEADGRIQAEVQMVNTTSETCGAALILAVYDGAVLQQVKIEEIVCESGFRGGKSLGMTVSGSEEQMVRAFLFEDLAGIRPMLPSAEARLSELKQ